MIQIHLSCHFRYHQKLHESNVYIVVDITKLLTTKLSSFGKLQKITTKT